MFGANTGEVQEVRQYLADGTATVANVSYDSYGNLSQMMVPANYRDRQPDST